MSVAAAVAIAAATWGVVHFVIGAAGDAIGALASGSCYQGNSDESTCLAVKLDNGFSACYWSAKTMSGATITILGKQQFCHEHSCSSYLNNSECLADYRGVGPCYYNWHLWEKLRPVSGGGMWAHAEVEGNGTVMSTDTPCGEATCSFIFNEVVDDSAEAACNAWGTVPKEVGANCSKPDLKIACEQGFLSCQEVRASKSSQARAGQSNDDGKLVIP